LSDQLIALQDQFAGLQAVWADTQKRNETLRLSNESLNKLNQELSQSLRRERTSPRSNQAAIEVPRTAAHAGTQVGTVQKLDKIDHLLSELETGLAISFGKSRDSDIHKLDILDDQISS
jgi:hypothetical protein